MVTKQELLKRIEALESEVYGPGSPELSIADELSADLDESMRLADHWMQEAVKWKKQAGLHEENAKRAQEAATRLATEARQQRDMVATLQTEINAHHAATKAMREIPMNEELAKEDKERLIGRVMYLREYVRELKEGGAQ